MKRAFIFVGQGQQFPEMGVDLYLKYENVKEIYDKAQSVLGYDLLKLDAEKLMDSMYIQPSLYVLGHALDTVLKDLGIIPDVVAGLSLGEFNALTSASVISFEEGLQIIEKRAGIMSGAFEPFETKMAAVLKTNSEVLREAIEGSNVEICNYNSPNSLVIGGLTRDIDAVLPKLKEQKIMAIPLKMSTVSHHSLLDEASYELKEVLKSYSFKRPLIRFINNSEATYQDDDFVDSLAFQISKPTHMGAIIEKMKQDGVTDFIEVGPKGSLSRLIKEICGSDVNVHNVYDTLSLEEVSHG